MKYAMLCCGAVLAGSLIAGNAYADADHVGLEFRAEMSPAIVKLQYIVSREDDEKKEDGRMIGSNTTFSLGYRWPYIGVYFDQEFGMVYMYEEGDGIWFMGGSFVTARTLLPLVSKHFEFDFEIGAGMMYSDGKKSDDGGRAAIFRNKDDKPIPAFAIKTGASMTWYITSDFGLGLHFDYIFTFNILKDVEDGDYKYDKKLFIHQMSPGLHVRAQF